MDLKESFFKQMDIYSKTYPSWMLKWVKENFLCNGEDVNGEFEIEWS